MSILGLLGIIVLVVILAGGAVALVAWAYSQRFIVVHQDEAVAISGLGYRQSMILTGGGKFVWPVIQSWRRLSLQPFHISVPLTDAESKEGVGVEVTVEVQIGFIKEDGALRAAFQNVQPALGDGNRRDVFEANLIGSVNGIARGVLASLSVLEAFQNQSSLLGRVKTESEPVFGQLGLQVQALTIKSFKDNGHILEDLARMASAESKRKADEKVAEETKQAAISKATADEKVDAAQHTLALQRAARDSEVKAANAKSEQAGRLADQEARSAVIAAQAANDLATAEGANKVALSNATSEAQAAAAKLKIETEATAEKTRIEAQATRDQKLLEAEASRATAEALNSFSQTAMLMQMWPQLIGTIQAGFNANASALAKANITLVGSENSGISASLANMFGPGLASIFAVLKSVGIDIPQRFNSEATETSSDQNGHDPVADAALVASAATDTASTTADDSAQ